MMHWCGLALFIFFLPGTARRSIRVRDSHYDAKQQNNTLTKGLEVSVDARAGLLPRGFVKARFRYWAPHDQPLPMRSGMPFSMATSSKVLPQQVQVPPQENLLLDTHGRHAGHLEPRHAAPLLRVGPRPAAPLLRAKPLLGVLDRNFRPASGLQEELEDLDGCRLLTLSGMSIWECEEPPPNPSEYHGDLTGNRIWDAGRVLARLLECGNEMLCVPVAGLRVLELGSGTGIGGLAAAAVGASKVVLTDKSEEALPLLKANARENGFDAVVHVRRLEWGSEMEMEEVAALGPFDLIVGSDLLYTPEAVPALLQTLERLCTAQTEVLLVYPRRYTEQIFFEAAEAFEVEDEVEPDIGVYARLLSPVSSTEPSSKFG